ncbi:hypothetical protein H0E87_002626 [Populus deltoides]|uniref:Uncharacterized protein n=1 Tax=Populus deltoides TaxID=3696 RepID=A0A8T2ZW70_POPDE|nr:hypothetical protein H0E87_002626 [Populus deltoides]
MGMAEDASRPNVRLGVVASRPSVGLDTDVSKPSVRFGMDASSSTLGLSPVASGPPQVILALDGNASKHIVGLDVDASRSNMAWSRPYPAQRGSGHGHVQPNMGLAAVATNPTWG